MVFVVYLFINSTLSFKQNCLACQCDLMSNVFAVCVFADLVLLDKKSAAELRTTLRAMLTDSERRQALIQELVMSNNQLK